MFIFNRVANTLRAFIFIVFNLFEDLSMSTLWSPRFVSRAFAGLGLAFAAASAAAEPLSLQVYNAGAGSFHANAVLVSGKQEAMLIDTGFSRADALRIAGMVLDSGKSLKTIYISQADPDFYFGIDTMRRLFPGVRVVATAPTIAKIKATLPTKLKVWGPRLGANAPQDVPLPDPVSGNLLELEGQAIEIRGLDDALSHRSYLWIPSIGAIAGGVNVFAGLHVWTADTQSASERSAWMAKLDAMAALQPKIVIPGHEAAGQPRDVSQIAWTKTYLQRFEAELTKASASATLIDAMKGAYPSAGLAVALDIGAKVNKGEMKW